ncbi:MAG: hypothetical protein ABJH72_07600 [Reichenbachiella sp.]|uniref:toxin-antitoxin system YwqK family antitoxin n=1 Tax=Reichenbachiella sp. TaxID=2184521 RepID=UPI0032662BAF
MKKFLAIGLLLISTSLLGQGVVLRTYYDQEKTVVKEVFAVDDTISNQLNGPYTSYYLSGIKKSEGYYTNNKASGQWTYYFENGRVRQSGSFLYGRTVGIWSDYFENGKLRSEGILSNGKKGGEWSYYYEVGSLKSRGQYDDEIRTGTWEYYYEGGGMKAQTMFRNGSGTYKEYYVSGQLKTEGLNKSGKSDSLWVHYFESGEKMAEGYYKQGLKTGPWKYFYKNGKLSAEGGYENGQTLGNWIYYYSNGAKSAEGLQKNGSKDGYWKMFYDSGVIKGVGEFDEGTGEYKEYYISGNLKVTGNFRGDLNYGQWTYYDEEGNVEGQAQFDEDGIGKYEGYYLNGNVKMMGNLSQGRRVGEWTLYKKNGEVAGTYLPVYGENNPVFMKSEAFVEQANKEDYDKPEYKFKNRKSRYFTSRVNEYKGVIFGSNPLYPILGFMPLAVEYYLQERQGFELIYTYHRKPFFENHNRISTGDLYATGSSVVLRHKFYSKDEPMGMLYFGHLIGADFIKHAAHISEGGTLATHEVRAKENRYYYGVFVGDRLLKDPANAGLTIDLYIGVGIGKRDYAPLYSGTTYDQYFTDVNQSSLYIPIFFGINIGYLGFKKTKNPIPSPR